MSLGLYCVFYSNVDLDIVAQGAFLLMNRTAPKPCQESEARHLHSLKVKFKTGSQYFATRDQVLKSRIYAREQLSSELHYVVSANVDLQWRSTLSLMIDWHKS